MMNKAPQKYWDNRYAKIDPHLLDRKHPVRLWLEANVPRTETGTCIEIGCYPGRYLSVFGELGYEIYGIDLTPRLTEVPKYLESSGFRLGEFWQEDFMTFDPGRSFDLVCSFGFIEHFTDLESVIDKHLALVAQGGRLLLQAPNFLGVFQNWFHRTLNAKSFALHNLSAMEVARWENYVASRGFQVEWSGYFGPFYFWYDPQERLFSERLLLNGLRVIKPFLSKVLPPNQKAYAPFGCLVALRQGKAHSTDK